MKVSNKTIDYLKTIITGDSPKTKYLTWPQLIKIFSNFGFHDEYWQGFPSRWMYCEQKLTVLNDLNRIEEVIEFYYKPINFIEDSKWYEELLKELNMYLSFDDLELKVDKKNCKVVQQDTENSVSEASFTDGTISIVLQKEVFSHVKGLLESKHYFNAVEEAYKIVRQKLKSITGKEKAHEWFKEDNYEVIFWHKPIDEAEADFFEGVKFLHLAIQKLRNEKSHTPAMELDKNLAIHYIVLASLAYDLISRNIK